MRLYVIDPEPPVTVEFGGEPRHRAERPVLYEGRAADDERVIAGKGADCSPVAPNVAAVNAHIPDEKRALALELLNLITGPELMIEVSENGGAPRYLFAARESVYDALAPEYPIYGALKDIAMDPEARVFRIKPDGVAYIKQAKQSASLLPVLGK